MIKRFLLVIGFFCLPLLVNASPAIFEIDQDNIPPDFDFSWMNKPLTASDRLVARSGHFFAVGNDLKAGTADDRRVRLFGVNLVGAANFPEESNARGYAQRLAHLGINLVRLHHMDTFVDDNSSGYPSAIVGRGPYPELDPTAVKRLRKFIQELSSAGIYVSLNLHVGYRFDGVRDQLGPELQGIQFPPKSKPFQYLSTELISRQARYAKALILQLDLVNKAVLANVEITNESSLVGTYRTGELFTMCRQTGAKPFIRLFDDTDLSMISKNGEVDLSRCAWLGLDAPATTKRTVYEMLLEKERRYFDFMKLEIRKAYGGEVAILGTQVAFAGFAGLPAQAAMDYVDNHFYVDHFYFPGKKWDAKDWSVKNTNPLTDGIENLLNGFAPKLLGKPYVISEFNQSWPSQYGQTILPLVSVLGRLQDIDAIVLFNYSNLSNWNATAPAGFSVEGDPAKISMMGVSAYLFRMAEIPSLPVTKVCVAKPVVSEEIAGKKRFKVKAYLPANVDDWYWLFRTGSRFEYCDVDTPSPIRSSKNASIVLGNDVSVFFDPDQPVLHLKSDSFSVLIGNIARHLDVGFGISIDPRLNSAFDFVTLVVINDARLPNTMGAKKALIVNGGYSSRSALGKNGAAEPEALNRKNGIIGRYSAVDESGKVADLRKSIGPAWLTFPDLDINITLDDKRWSSVETIGNKGDKSIICSLTIGAKSQSCKLTDQSPWTVVNAK